MPDVFGKATDRIRRYTIGFAQSDARLRTPAVAA